MGRGSPPSWQLAALVFGTITLFLWSRAVSLYALVVVVWSASGVDSLY